MAPALLSDPICTTATFNNPLGTQGINVIVPIGGVGSRFSKEGYRFPKPLINIVGRPMILRMIDNLSLRPQDTLWMAVNESIDDEFRIGQLVAKTFPKIDFKLLRLKHQTRGASETLYITTQSMTPEQLKRKTVSLDCDTIYWADILEHIRDSPSGSGAVFHFPDDGDKPIYSYIKTEENTPGIICDIQEKKAISNKANTGAYVFATAELLNEWGERYIDEHALKVAQGGEYYTSQLIRKMILDGKLPFLGLPLQKKDFSCVGTPDQLEDLILELKRNEQHSAVKKRRFCFDLDMTLVGVPVVAGDYSTCPPIWKNIRLVQQLHLAGHHIIIQTARRMRTHHGNVGAILKDVGIVTFEQLAKYNIPYDDIHFGKPWADVYVDDLAVNANMDTMKEIGWLLSEPENSLFALAKPTHTRNGSKVLVAARDFNTIQIFGDKVIKSSKSENILGELFFYAHLPEELKSVFPRIDGVDYLPETGTYTIEMEYRKGLTFSHLLVGRSITRGRLLTLLKGLLAIHTTKPNPAKPNLVISDNLKNKFAEHSIDATGGGVNIYANYGSKLRTRYYSNKNVYLDLGPEAAEAYSRIHEFLDTYEAEDRGVHSSIIHGDPVFSNIILAKDESCVSFIDVRCQLSSTLTMEGDIHYDLAKVLQSLCGYDHLLFISDEELKLREEEGRDMVDEADERILSGLREVFWAWVGENYGKVHRKTLLRVTASLLFTLIPLHKKNLHKSFLRMCLRTLEMAGGEAIASGFRTPE